MKGIQVSQTRIEKFLAAYAKYGVIAKACRLSGCQSRSVYNWREKSPEFEAAFQRADMDFADRVENEVIRRAIRGYKKPIYQGGKLVGHEIRYSDGLARDILRAKKPEYREEAAAFNLQAQILVTPAIPVDEEDFRKIVDVQKQKLLEDEEE